MAWYGEPRKHAAAALKAWVTKRRNAKGKKKPVAKKKR